MERGANPGMPGFAKKGRLHVTVRTDFRRVPLLDELSEEELRSIRPHLKINEYASGTSVIRQHEPASHFHIIVSGKLKVLVRQEVRAHVATLEAGQFFGEMSCLTGGPVSATVEADGPVVTVSMPREGLLRLMDSSAAFRRHMIEAMVRRIASSNDRVLEEHARSAAIVRELAEERQTRYGRLAGEGRFMRRLRSEIEALAAGDQPLCIVGEPGTGKTHAAWEIHARSERAGHPVFVVSGADFRMAEWELKARTAEGGTIILKDADALPAGLLPRLAQAPAGARLIMTARQPVALPAARIEMAPLRERKEDVPALVRAFIEEAGFEEPERLMSQEALNLIGNFPFLGGNIRELKQVVREALIRSGGQIVRVAHLRFGSVRQPGARPKVALALGSGAARGAAHVGVIKVLEKAGIPIDIITGTSVGAFIGALYAGGQPTSAFEEVLPTVRWRQLVRPALSGGGLVDNHPMVRFVEKYIGPADFRDLRIPFAAVASNAVDGEAYILNTGKVSHAICASTAIPGVMRPVRLGNHLLSDGAVAHPVPVALAKSMGADIVIAVDVRVPDSMKKPPASFVGAILNTIDIMSKRMIQDELQLADFVLNPQFGTSAMSFKESAVSIQAGEQAALESLAAIERRLEELDSGKEIRP